MITLVALPCVQLKGGMEEPPCLGITKLARSLVLGSIRIRMFDVFERVLQEVSYVTQLNRNHISLVMLDQSGCTFKVEN